MPKGSKVDEVYEALLKKGYSKEKAARIAQSRTGEALATGKKPKHAVGAANKQDAELLQPSSTRVTPSPGNKVLRELREARIAREAPVSAVSVDEPENFRPQEKPHASTAGAIGMAGQWVPEFGKNMSWTARQLAQVGRNDVGRRMDKEKIGDVPGGLMERKRFFDGISGGLEAGRALLKQLGHQDFEERPDQWSPSVIDFFSRGENPQQIGRWIGRTNTLRADLPPEGGWADRRPAAAPPEAPVEPLAPAATPAPPAVEPEIDDLDSDILESETPTRSPEPLAPAYSEFISPPPPPAVAAHTFRNIPTIAAAREHLRAAGHRRLNEIPQFGRSGRVISVRLVTRDQNPRQVGEWFPDGTLEIGNRPAGNLGASNLPMSTQNRAAARALGIRFCNDQAGSSQAGGDQEHASMLRPSSTRVTPSPGMKVLQELRQAKIQRQPAVPVAKDAPQDWRPAGRGNRLALKAANEIPEHQPDGNPAMIPAGSATRGT